MVSGVADRVIEALRNAIDDRPADPRLLAVGLLAVQAQMPVISSLIDNSRHRQELRKMTLPQSNPFWDCTKQSKTVSRICGAQA
jgi:hypothetical protein